jgi:hypothetical protein
MPAEFRPVPGLMRRTVVVDDPRVHTCPDCGKEFTGARNAQRCAVCRKVRSKNLARKNLQKLRARRKAERAANRAGG